VSEPLLGVQVPEALGRQTEGFAAPGPGGVQLAIVLQAFDDVKAQTCLAGICALYIRAGVRLLAVESADDRIAPRPGNVDIKQLIRTENVSAGVLSLVNAGLPSVEGWGVDLSLIPPSYSAMHAVSGARAQRDQVFEQAIRPLLRRAQESLYPAELTAFRRARLDIYESRKAVLEQARLAQAAARKVGLDLSTYGLVLRFLDMGEKEKHQDQSRAQQQMEEFVRRVVERAHNWVKPAGGNRLTIDLEKAAPVLEFWLRETGQSVDDFYAAVKGPNPEPVFRACKQWYDAWFKSGATTERKHEFFENLMRLALYLEVPYFELRDFREYVAQLRDSEALRTGLDDEMSDLSSALVDQAGATALGEVEDRFDLIHRMCGLAVNSRDAEARVRSIGTIAEAIELLESVAPAARGTVRWTPQDLAPVEKSLNAAKEFLQLSRERSAHMVKRTLELIEQRNEDRAVLAIGGFHARAVTRVMDDYPEVSWAILMPQVDVDSAWRQHRERF
jgi:hypothetical protein